MKLSLRRPNTGVLRQRIASKLDRYASSLLRDIYKGVVGRTPVDTGRAKRGWRLNLRAQHIINRVPYIGILDDGKSRQAPRGMTKPAIDAALNKKRWPR